MEELPVILQLNKVDKLYRKKKVLKDISLSLQQGKIYGLIGQNGAGKTTIMRIITGLVFADSGNVELFGNKSRNILSQLRKDVGSIIEAPALYPNLTAIENIEIVRKMKRVPKDKSFNDILNILEITYSVKKVKNFSLGMKQKLGIAMALIGEPKLLILDEPLNGIDPIAIVHIREYLKKLVNQKKTTILISSHILSELYKFASDYIVIDKGEVKKVISKRDMEEAFDMNISLEEIYMDLLGEGEYYEKPDRK